ncbi:hypothetical protein AMK16_25210 [Streptomyces sp. CB00455]|uniref:hypothetical protein n=1 Tax=Streptomyces sp. CB00455 TaxID=1703927 RepID=UPI0009402082|nr:hypothetical protein [Streptomyces sp. CB00455]OKK16039.1 hypothetical protein AMK16_25210 [Streptomyces sp. CB00455]
MHRRSKALYGVLAAVLGVSLTACGGADAEGGKSGVPEGRTAKDAAGQPGPSASPSASPSDKPQWGPALAMGRPAPKLYEPKNTAGGKFEVTATKIVKGTAEQAKSLHWDKRLPGEPKGDTPYFVYITYTLKEGKPGVANPDLGAHAAALDMNGVHVAERPTVHTGYVEGGCTVPPVYMGWDIGETRTLCTVFAGDRSNPPARLAWATDVTTDEDYMRGASWEWTAK